MRKVETCLRMLTVTSDARRGGKGIAKFQSAQFTDRFHLRPVDCYPAIGGNASAVNTSTSNRDVSVTIRIRSLASVQRSRGNSNAPSQNPCDIPVQGR